MLDTSDHSKTGLAPKGIRWSPDFGILLSSEGESHRGGPWGHRWSTYRSPLPSFFAGSGSRSREYRENPQRPPTPSTAGAEPLDGIWKTSMALCRCARRMAEDVEEGRVASQDLPRTGHSAGDATGG